MEKTIDQPVLLDELREEFSRMLGVPVAKLPGDVPPEIASKYLSVALRTLAIWRCNGRYDLEYYKAGRMVRYRTASLIRFKASRIHMHTGEAA